MDNGRYMGWEGWPGSPQVRLPCTPHGLTSLGSTSLLQNSCLVPACSPPCPTSKAPVLCSSVEPTVSRGPQHSPLGIHTAVLQCPMLAPGDRHASSSPGCSSPQPPHSLGKVPLRAHIPALGLPQSFSHFLPIKSQTGVCCSESSCMVHEQ